MNLLLVLYLIAKICVSNGNVQLVKCLESDRDALIGFKNGLDDPENRLSSWQGSNCCQWSGISCDNSRGAVVAVDLHNPPPFYSNSSGSGTIPPNLGNLSSLEYLDVISHSNLVVDNLEWMAGLVSLKHLMMSGVDLSMVLSLGMNGLLRGSCFKLFRKGWKKIESLDLSKNHLSGELPASIDWLGQLANLVHLGLAFNCFQGPIPASLWSLLHLTGLALNGNKLNGTISDSLGQLSELISFDVSFNYLTGILTESHFSKLTKLEFLYLSFNLFTLNVSSNWVPPFQLWDIFMSKFHLGPSFPVWLKSQKKVENLEISYASISGPIPLPVGQIAMLDLSNNTFSGPIPRNIENNNLFGEIPASLRVAFRDGLEIVSDILEFSACDQMHFLENFPPSLSNLISLLSPGLGGKQVEWYYSCWTFGDLKAMAQVQNRKQLSFWNGAMHGHLLSRKLGCGYKRPVSESLVVLNLSRNHISGQIPKNISNLHQLSSLDLSSNSLSGPIPPSMPSLSFLEFLNLSNNNFSSTIPYTGQLTTFEASSFAGNPGLCGHPLDVKCQGEGSKGEEPAENMDSGEEVTDTWFYLSVGLGFAAGLLVPYFILTINEAWRNAYFAFIDEVAARFFGLRHRTTHRRNRHNQH
uniref:Leucine-rich repeat-containing N-terminal plant-type domain-containing protein n=1 Tax=Fagus sylvatica TaxID=28930 RepID=A0A2N9FUL9_FAGSY